MVTFPMLKQFLACRSLQDAAVEAARKAVFEPLSNNGQAVKTRAVIAYNFQML